MKDKLQETIKQKFEDLSEGDKKKYLQESIEWHRQVAHYHLYMERGFAKQLEEYNDDQNIADSAPSLAKPDEAEPQLAIATEAE